MKRLPLAAVLGLLLHALISSPAIPNFSRAFFSTPVGYADRRNLHAFHGIPMNALRAKFDQLLKPGEPVALGDGLRRIDYLQQRFSEALYPRRIDQNAGARLDFTPENGNLSLFLNGAPVKLQPLPAPDPAESAFSLLSFLVPLLSALGIGLAFEKLAFREGSGLPGLAAWPLRILVAACVVGVAGTLATCAQVPLPWAGMHLVGVALFLVGLFGKAIFAKTIRELARLAPESVFFLILLLFFLARVALFPVALWDGRSIWLFHAKQIAQSGMLSLRDIQRPEYIWSHPVYPVLAPTWLAYFSSFCAGFNERMASLGLPVLLAALLSLAWIRLRELLGRALGAVLCLHLFVVSENLVAGGYVDSFVMLALLLSVLFLRQGRIAGLALMLASLTKIEGLAYGLAFAAFAIAWVPQARAKRAAVFVASFAPAVAHQIWLKVAGAGGNYSGLWSQAAGASSASQTIAHGGALEAAWSRLIDLLALFPLYLSDPGYLKVRFFFAEAGLFFALVLGLRGAWPWLTGRPCAFGGFGTACASLGAFVILSAFGVLMAMSTPVAVAIDGFDRYSLPGSTLFLVSAFCFLRSIEQGKSGLDHAVPAHPVIREK